MKNAQLDRDRKKLDHLISLTPKDPIEAQSEWAKYICVRVAGYVENFVRELYYEYSKKRSHPAVAAYVQKCLKGIQNPRPGKLYELAGTFDIAWRKKLESFVDDDGRAAAIEAIMTNRHLIAHGRDSTISMAQVKDYLKKIDSVADFIESSLAAGS